MSQGLHMTYTSELGRPTSLLGEFWQDSVVAPVARDSPDSVCRSPHEDREHAPGGAYRPFESLTSSALIGTGMGACLALGSKARMLW